MKKKNPYNLSEQAWSHLQNRRKEENQRTRMRSLIGASVFITLSLLFFGPIYIAWELDF